MTMFGSHTVIVMLRALLERESKQAAADTSVSHRNLQVFGLLAHHPHSALQTRLKAKVDLHPMAIRSVQPEHARWRP